MAALRRPVERLNDNLVAVDALTLTTAERNKLRAHGILLQGESKPYEEQW